MPRKAKPKAEKPPPKKVEENLKRNQKMKFLLFQKKR